MRRFTSKVSHDSCPRDGSLSCCTGIARSMRILRPRMCHETYIELGEHGLTPASSQVTYLLLLTSFLLASLSYHYMEYKNDYLFSFHYVLHALEASFVWELYDILRGCWSAVGTAALFHHELCFLAAQRRVIPGVIRARAGFTRKFYIRRSFACILR